MKIITAIYALICAVICGTTLFATNKEAVSIALTFTFAVLFAFASAMCYAQVKKEIDAINIACFYITMALIMGEASFVLGYHFRDKMFLLPFIGMLASFILMFLSFCELQNKSTNRNPA